MRRLPYAAALTLVALLLPACGSQQRFSEADVKQAFRAHGFQLTAGVVRGKPLRRGNNVVLVPRSGESFFVLVADDDDAADAYYRTLRSQPAAGAFEVRRRNVVASSDEGLTGEQRRRVRAALRSLR